jgi:hypothetical protein
LYTSTSLALRANCLNLKTLVIHYEEEIEGLAGIAHACWGGNGFAERNHNFNKPDLSMFFGLTTLEVSNLHGDLPEVRCGLVQVLLNSPGLQALALSISLLTLERFEMRSVDYTAEYLEFWEQTCLDYAEAGGIPLRLRKIVLGLSVLLWKPGTYLAGLTDLKYLEDVYIHNDYYCTPLQSMETEDNIAWSLLTPTNCPNLTSFGVTKYNKSVKKWGDSLDGGYIKQLAIKSGMIKDLAGMMSDKEDRRASSHHKLKSLTTAMNPMFNESYHSDNLNALSLKSFQALSMRAWYDTPEHRYKILERLKETTRLEQLLLYGCQGNGRESMPVRGSFEYEIAVECTQLQYLRLDKVAWRITRSRGVDDGLNLGFERLDRFEIRAAEEFQATGIFNDNWDPGKNIFKY